MDSSYSITCDPNEKFNWNDLDNLDLKREQEDLITLPCILSKNRWYGLDDYKRRAKHHCVTLNKLAEKCAEMRKSIVTLYPSISCLRAVDSSDTDFVKEWNKTLKTLTSQNEVDTLVARMRQAYCDRVAVYKELKLTLSFVNEMKPGDLNINYCLKLKLENEQLKEQLKNRGSVSSGWCCASNPGSNDDGDPGLDYDGDY